MSLGDVRLTKHTQRTECYNNKNPSLVPPEIWHLAAAHKTAAHAQLTYNYYDTVFVWSDFPTDPATADLMLDNQYYYLWTVITFCLRRR